MTTQRRGFLKALPIAALAATSVEVAGNQAERYELKKQKKYVFVVSGEWSLDAIKGLSRNVAGMGIDATVIYDTDSNLKIYEVQ